MTGRAIPSGPGVSVDPAALIAERAHVLRQPFDDAATSALPGGFVIKRRGNGQVIADSRAYVDGDDIRHVDRGATARTGKLHIRTFQEERDRVTFLVADFRPSMLWGMRRAFRSVAAAHALARLGWQAVEAGGRVGMMAVTARGTLGIPIRGRVRGMLAVIGGLAKAHEMALEAAGEGLADARFDLILTGLRRVVPSGSAIVIATGMDTPGARFDDVMGELAGRRYPRFLIVEDHALGELRPGHYTLGAPDGTRTRATIPGRNAGMAIRAVAPPGFPAIHVDAGAAIRSEILQLGQ